MAQSAVGGGSEKSVDRRAMGTLSAAHMFTDVNQGAVAALIPFLTTERGLSLAAAGALVLAATVSSSVVQPLFGVFSDNRPLPALMPLGVLVAGVGMSLVGVAPSFPLIFCSVVLSGIGVAAFHPESARFANYVSGSRRARGMSFFSVGGNAGFALGPALTTPLVLLFGLPGTLLLVVPAFLMALVLFHELPRLSGFRPAARREGEPKAEELPSRWSPFVRVVTVVALRSFVYFGFVSFLASYYVRDLGTSPAFGNAALTVMLFGGAAGTLLLGNLADRVGRKTVLAASMAALIFLVPVLLLCGPVVGIFVGAVLGAALIGTFSVTVVMGQEYLPGKVGLAAGVTMGLSIGVGGVGASILGAFADAHGLRATILLMAALPALGLLLTLTLPGRKAT